MRVDDFNDFIKGKPDKSGNYVIKNEYGMIGTDDYTTSGGGHWWNESNDGGTLYSPSSFRGLGEEDTTPTNWSPRGTTEECFGCEYYYGEIDQCMYGEPDVPDNLVRKCKLIE